MNDKDLFEQKIEAEVQQLLITIEKGNEAFLPNEYKRWRREGFEPEDIDYDMCHIWR